MSTRRGHGVDAYRFSVEWARVEPVEAEFAEDALDHYEGIVDRCRERGLAPVVTAPHWFAMRGGWLDGDAPSRFASYCDRVMARLGDRIAYAVTLNEPNLARLLTWIGFPDVVRELPPRGHSGRHRRATAARRLTPSRSEPQAAVGAPGRSRRSSHWPNRPSKPHASRSRRSRFRSAGIGSPVATNQTLDWTDPGFRSVATETDSWPSRPTDGSCWTRCRVCGGERRVRGEHPHHPERRHSHRGHQRGHRSRRLEPVDRHWCGSCWGFPWDPAIRLNSDGE